MTLSKCDVDAHKVHTAMTSHQPQRGAQSETRATAGEQHVSCTSVQEWNAHSRPRSHPRARPDEREEARKRPLTALQQRTKGQVCGKCFSKKVLRPPPHPQGAAGFIVDLGRVTHT